jgi:hypothetical protein
MNRNKKTLDSRKHKRRGKTALCGLAFVPQVTIHLRYPAVKHVVTKNAGSTTNSAL